MALHRWLGVVLAWGALLGSTSTAAAAEADSATRSAARKLGTTGVEEYQAGDYAAASDKLDRAYAALKVPSLGLWSARALIKLNRWVEASERLVEVSRLQPGSGDLAVQRAALADAATELAALTPRIPSVVLELKNAEAGEVSITIDGRSLAASLVGAAVPVDPGSHRFVARNAAGSSERTASFAEAESKHVLLDLGSARAPAALDAPATSRKSQASDTGQRDAASPGGATQRTLAIAAAGVGVLGLGIGTFFYVEAKGDSDQAKKLCPTSVDCSSGDIATHSSLVESIKSERLAGYLGWGLGGAALVTGAVLYFAAPRAPQTTTSARLRFDVAPVAGRGYLCLVQGVLE